MINRSKALNIFRTKITGADVGVLCDELVEDFVDAFEKLADTDADKISTAFIAIKYLMQFGTAEQLERVQDRANRFPLEILETVQKLVDESRGVDARDESAVEHFVDIIDTRYKNLKTESLMEQHDNLVEATKDGESLTPDNAGFQGYRKNMVALRNVCLELRKLGQNVELLGSSADPDEAESENGTAGVVKESAAIEAKAPKENSENEYLTADEEEDEKDTEADINKNDDEKSEIKANQENDRPQELGDDGSKNNLNQADQATGKDDTNDESKKEDDVMSESKVSEDNSAQAKDSFKTDVPDKNEEDGQESSAREKGATSKTEDEADEEETDTEDEGSVLGNVKTKE